MSKYQLSDSWNYFWQPTDTKMNSVQLWVQNLNNVKDQKIFFLINGFYLINSIHDGKFSGGEPKLSFAAIWLKNKQTNKIPQT